MLTVREIYQMLGNETLWQTATRCHEVLASAKVPHAIAGGVAVCLHGYQRNTVDLDLIIRPADSETVRQILTQSLFLWDQVQREFRSESGIPVHFLLAGDRAGAGSEVTLPSPDEPDAITEIEKLPVLSLAKLIESKIACGEGYVRRTHKDFADVVELIAVHNLSSSFARYLHKSVRSTFRKLVEHAHG